ncbi:hypothetical protein FRC09_001104 [Ceratobasidium sp. 395]|nr:hypothetical protein FRC09_001104 [Ceratobasidium sp. 395]
MAKASLGVTRGAGDAAMEWRERATGGGWMYEALRVKAGHHKRRVKKKDSSRAVASMESGAAVEWFRAVSLGKQRTASGTASKWMVRGVYIQAVAGIRGADVSSRIVVTPI